MSFAKFDIPMTRNLLQFISAAKDVDYKIDLDDWIKSRGEIANSTSLKEGVELYTSSVGKFSVTNLKSGVIDAVVLAYLESQISAIVKIAEGLGEPTLDAYGYAYNIASGVILDACALRRSFRMMEDLSSVSGGSDPVDNVKDQTNVN